jgi:hypothetical protein
MSEDPEAAYERSATQRMMRRLDGFARGLGLDEAATRQIVEKVAADMAMRTDEERLPEARSDDQSSGLAEPTPMSGRGQTFASTSRSTTASMPSTCGTCWTSITL